MSQPIVSICPTCHPTHIPPGLDRVAWVLHQLGYSGEDAGTILDEIARAGSAWAATKLRDEHVRTVEDAVPGPDPQDWPDWTDSWEERAADEEEWSLASDELDDKP